MDFKIFNILHSLSGKGVFLDFFIVLLAKYLPYILGAAALFFLWKVLKGSAKEKIYAWFFTLLVLILSRGIIVSAFRFFYHRPRPFTALEFTPLLQSESFSFPSGHAAFFFALAFVFFSFNRKWGWWFMALVLVNGVARIVAGLHWPSDILGGIGVALISFLIVKKVLSSVQEKIENRPE